MFGPDYEIDEAISERVLSDDEYKKELEHEKSSMELSRKYFDSVEAGDDQKIKEILLGINPSDTMADA